LLAPWVHCSHENVAQIIGDSRIDFVAFTGSVAGGHAVQRAAAERFIGTGLELGGKDPAYVRADVDLEHAVANIADGVFFNSGQSCCGVERVYVHRDRFDAFVDGFCKLVYDYRLGDPLEAETNLGPMARTRGAQAVRAQISGMLRTLSTAAKAQDGPTAISAQWPSSSARLCAAASKSNEPRAAKVANRLSSPFSARCPLNHKLNPALR